MAIPKNKTIKPYSKNDSFLCQENEKSIIGIHLDYGQSNKTEKEDSSAIVSKPDIDHVNDYKAWRNYSLTPTLKKEYPLFNAEERIKDKDIKSKPKNVVKSKT
eukprot:CAMPEP_0116984888 /NCGR_PEP_ID=MMETSP0467-20121206/61898_1 /TAXON_ID=283647 /ORGANISM="Mesodinium pulex, Strain SPMC105" /LENGTH=102 /DNA_ID=CAMNT_0004680041 /DNA_START=158 /DNA_END=466 /DNA_ORIENTATION=-